MRLDSLEVAEAGGRTNTRCPCSAAERGRTESVGSDRLRRRMGLGQCYQSWVEYRRPERIDLDWRIQFVAKR